VLRVLANTGGRVRSTHGPSITSTISCADDTATVSATFEAAFSTSNNIARTDPAAFSSAVPGANLT